MPEARQHLMPTGLSNLNLTNMPMITALQTHFQDPAWDSHLLGLPAPSWLVSCWPHLFIPDSAKMTSPQKTSYCLHVQNGPALVFLPLLGSFGAAIAMCDTLSDPSWAIHFPNSTATSRTSEIISVLCPHFDPRPQHCAWHTGDGAAIKQPYLV